MSLTIRRKGVIKRDTLDRLIDTPGTDASVPPNGVPYTIYEKFAVENNSRGSCVSGTVEFEMRNGAKERYHFELTSTDMPMYAHVRQVVSDKPHLTSAQITASYPENHRNTGPTRYMLQEVFSRHYGVGADMNDANREPRRVA